MSMEEYTNEPSRDVKKWMVGQVEDLGGWLEKARVQLEKIQTEKNKLNGEESLSDEQKDSLVKLSEQEKNLQMSIDKMEETIHSLREAA